MQLFEIEGPNLSLIFIKLLKYTSLRGFRDPNSALSSNNPYMLLNSKIYYLEKKIGPIKFLVIKLHLIRYNIPCLQVKP